MSQPKTCRRCGAPLPAGHAADAPCPRCLLQLGFEESGPSPPRFELPEFDEVVRTFPQLEILEHVGTGGMGVVYHARQKGLDRDVALKLLSVEAASDPAFAERFTREARALASLTHPAITSVHDFGQVGRFYYLLMEYVDGANLRQVMNAGGLSAREALALVGRMCDALQYAHDHGVVHRDIKPENVLIDRAGNLKIIDFGLAKMLGQVPVAGPLTRTDQAMGTWHYMAPEQVEHPLEVDHRADIYSLGVVFYELLTGELPLGRFSPPSQRVQVDVRLDDIVLRTLEKEPADRYQRANEVKTDLDRVTSTKPEPALAAARAAAPKPERKRSSPARIVLILAGLLLGLMLLGGCLGVLFLFVGVRRVEPPTPSIENTTSPESSPAPFVYGVDGTAPVLESDTPTEPAGEEPVSPATEREPVVETPAEPEPDATKPPGSDG